MDLPPCGCSVDCKQDEYLHKYLKANDRAWAWEYKNKRQNADLEMVKRLAWDAYIDEETKCAARHLAKTVIELRIS